MIVKRYTPELVGDWAKVLSESRNGLFLHDRNFMEYHSDRFIDFSALAYVDNDPVMLLPASIEESASHVWSHAGLTFGGFLLKRELRGDAAVSLINSILDAIKDWGAHKLTVKLLPQIFTSYPSGEVEYALWQRGFSLVRRDLSSVLPLVGSIPFNTLKKRSVRKAERSGLVISKVPLVAFYGLLEKVLRHQHNVSPTHSLGELELLCTRFPNRIFVRGASRGDELFAGAVVFNYGHIWHTQYLASSDEGRALGALDLVIDAVICEAREKEVTHVSFGSSTEMSGTRLNTGLLWQKESYGARSITHDFMAGVL